jgi:hypothetical protein
MNVIEAEAKLISPTHIIESLFNAKGHGIIIGREIMNSYLLEFFK